jgi:molybdopterin-guanine dinucleotide biosynthesis protein A
MREATIGLFSYASRMKGNKLPEEMLLGGKKIGMMALERALDISDRVISVVSSEEQAEAMETIAQEKGVTISPRVVNDMSSVSTVVSTALAMCDDGFLLAMPSASPYVSADILGLVLELLEDRDGIFFRDKGGSIYEFLFGVKVQPTRSLLGQQVELTSLSDLLDRLLRTMAISWNAATTLDPLHLSYFKVSTDSDFKTAQNMFKKVMRR